MSEKQASDGDALAQDKVAIMADVLRARYGRDAHNVAARQAKADGPSQATWQSILALLSE